MPKPLCSKCGVLNLPAVPMMRLVVLSASVSFYEFCVYGGIINGFESAGPIIAGVPVYFAVLWVASDARQTRHWPAYHYGLFLLMFSFVLIPHYILNTRGTSGIALAFAVSCLIWGPVVAAYAGWWFYEDLPDFR